MSGPRVFDGKDWENVAEKQIRGHKGPVPQVRDGDGTIFVSMPSFRDGERCGLTLKSIFESAVDPSKVVVGLIEQNAPEDRFCIEEYCSFYGVKDYIKRTTVRKDMVKVAVDNTTGVNENCPHIDQIRLLAFHHLSARGPSFARAMTRKILGNEEFCLQIDAHTQFAEGWDQMAVEEWANTGNEFAVLSTTPADVAQKALYVPGGEKAGEVPKQCEVTFLEQGVPYFHSPGEGKAAELSKPLLSHTWSSGFSFSKCHLEETAPYDPHASYVMHVEQFARFVRFWTRGYDVYTPTKNIVYHDYRPHPDGHGVNEWFAPRKQRFRTAAVDRIKTFLQSPDINPTEVAQANLGVYGLGKRRTLRQLMKFMGIDLHRKLGNARNIKCANLEYVPYDSSISPMENLFSNPDDLDFQPEFPLRTSLTYYKQVPELFDQIDAQGFESEAEYLRQKYPFPSTTTLVSLWIFGLLIWCLMYMIPNSNIPQQQQPKLRKKTFKDV